MEILELYKSANENYKKLVSDGFFKKPLKNYARYTTHQIVPEKKINEVKAKATVKTPLQKRKRLLYDQANGICYLCESQIKFYSQATIDHVVPKSLGGSSDIDNCRIAHSVCNNKKGNLLLAELRLPFNAPTQEHSTKPSNNKDQ